MKTRALGLMVLALTSFAGGLVLAPALQELRDGPTKHDHATGKKGVYQCAMHPQIVSDEPGICPICQMKLQRVEEPEAAGDAAAEKDPIVAYRHPMRPDVTSPAPAKDEMGMDYLPVRKSEIAGDSEASTVPGHAPFTLTTERRQLIGVKTTTVAARDLEVVVRAVGKVAYDPALYRAIVEHREALAARAALGERALDEAKRGADALVRGARLRLRQLGLSEPQLAALGRGGRDPQNLLLPGKSVWIYAQVHEYQADLVRPGQKLSVTAPSAPGRTFAAEIAAVDPVLDAMTRTVRIRALVETPRSELRPESFVDVSITIPLGRALAVPEDAILDTGDHQIAFVVEAGGRFEPRELGLGRAAAGYHEVLSGIAAGEEVVTSANFLIDSESRFRAALAAFSARSGEASR